MKIVFISDTHGLHDDIVSLPPGDVLVHCGDSTMRGNLSELHHFNQWLGVLPYKHKIVIAGNHDWCFYSRNDESRKLLTNAIYLQDESVTIDRIKFYGSPWQPEFFDWAFNLPRAGNELKEKWDQIPDDTDVLITHGPPFNILDQVTHGNEHVGCTLLLDRVLKVQPKIHAFGHIHENGGQDLKFHNTHFINASMLNLRYKMYQTEPMVFEI